MPVLWIVPVRGMNAPSENRHCPGVVECRRLIEYEIGFRQGRCVNTLQNDRLFHPTA